MLLVDTLYLTSPGGIVLLKYLQKNLSEKGINAYYLIDKRIENNFSQCPTIEKSFLESSMKNRKQFYLEHKNDFSKILCFSNIPPPIPLIVPVYTFFHNVLLLQDCSYLPIKSRIFTFLKRQLIFYYKTNSNTWIVQTEFMKQLLIKKMRIPRKHVEVMPFYCKLNQMISSVSSKKSNSFIYPSTGIGHKNHIVLLKAWELLYEAGFNFELHLTIPETDVKLIQLMTVMKSKGINIQNHGIIEQHELFTLYQSCEYLVYPSLNESFGLPLIEAIQQNCKVIAADLPYSKETIQPTSNFNPYRPFSLKNAILDAVSQKDNEKKSLIISENRIDSFIELLNTPIIL